MEDEMKDEMEQKSLNMPKSLWALIEDARLRFIERTGVKIGRNSYMRNSGFPRFKSYSKRKYAVVNISNDMAF